MKISSICIITKNVQGLREFYTSVLSMEPSVSSEQYVEFNVQNTILSLYDLESCNELSEEPVTLTRDCHTFIEFEVEDVHKEYEHLKELNVKFAKRLTTQPWGISSTFFYDPDGNLINFFTRK